MSETFKPVVYDDEIEVSHELGEGDEPVVILETSSGLSLSTNSKTTQIARERKDGRSSTYPKFPNSFGLPSFLSCPGHTQEFCKPFCYGLISEGRTNVAKNLTRNLDALRGISEEEMYQKLSSMMATYQKMFEKEVAKGNLTTEDNFFRIHWDGDFFSESYARAWHRVIKENPQTKFWVYTRSFREPVDVVPIFQGENELSNLAFYLSVDVGNIKDAQAQVKKYPKILRAYCGETIEEALSIAHQFGVRNSYKPCPENTGEMGLVLNGHGACAECQVCIKRRPHILFIHKRGKKQVNTEIIQLKMHIPVEVALKVGKRAANSSVGYDKTLNGTNKNSLC